MSDEQPSDGEQPAAAPPPPQSKKRLDLGSILIALVVVGFFAENIAVMAYYKPWAHGMPHSADIATATTAEAGAGHGHGAAPDAEAEARKPRRGPITLYEMSPFLVNLADTTSHRYAKAQISLGFHDLKALEGLDTDKVLVAAARQVVSELLASRQAAELVTTEGKDLLRVELLARLNELPFTAEVTSVYITEFLVQF